MYMLSGKILYASLYDNVFLLQEQIGKGRDDLFEWITFKNGNII